MPRSFGKGKLWWSKNFRDKGYRLTAPRQAVLNVLCNAPDHPSAEDVYFRVREVHSNIGLTTVYRTLELLVSMGLASRSDFGDGRARYELCDGPKKAEHHHHLVCTECGRIIDYTDYIKEEMELLRKTEEGLSQKFNFRITDHIIQFHGLCDRCRDKS